MEAVDDATTDPAGAHESAAWLALPIVAIIAAYAVVVTGGFVWDDYFLVVNSPIVGGQGSWTSHFSQPFSINPLQEARSFYRPLITLSYRLDHRLWGGWPGGFHLTNVALHTVFVLLLFAICRRAGAGRSVSAWVTTLFALAPRLSESVAWVSGRTDVAAGILALSAVLLFKTGPDWWLRRILSGVLLLLALMCKEVALAAAATLAVLAWLQGPRPRSIGRWCVELVPVSSALGVYALLREAAMARAPDNLAVSGRNTATVVILTFEAIARYGWMILNPFEPRLQIGDSNHANPLIAAAGVAVMLGAALLVWKYRSNLSTYAWAALAWASVSVGLVLPAMPLDLNVVAADRFLYLPLAALALFLANPAERLRQKRTVPFMVGAAVLMAAFAVSTSVRARRWATEIPLWREAVAYSSREQPLPRIELSAALMRRGRYEEALGYLKEAAVSRDLAVAVNLATCLDKLGHREAAIGMVESVVRLQPRRVNARVNLMLLHARAGRFEVARRMGQALLADFPYHSDIPSLVDQVDRAMAEMQAISAGALAENVELKARKATLFDRLGALPEALALWRTVALDGSADVALRLRGAAYIALFGYRDMARETLDQMSRQPSVDARIPALQAALEARFDDG